MNNALLKDANFIASIKKEINIFKSIYAATPYNPNYIDSVSHGFELMIPPSLFWETLLATLRGTIIRYSKRKKKQREIDMQQLKNNIEILDEKVTTGTASQNEFDTLATLNNNLIELRSEMLKGAYIRSRADWLEFGEKPNKYFLNLENKNRINKNISEIKLENGETITNQGKILDELKNFYSTLYQQTAPQGDPDANNLNNT